MSRCPNCSAEVTQEYCPACGQRRIGPDDLSARQPMRSPGWCRRASDADPSRPLFNARFDLRDQSVHTIAVGIAAVVLASMLHLLYRKQRNPYGAHLMFALHFVAFVYLLTIVVGASGRLGVSTDLVAAAGYALLTPHLFLAPSSLSSLSSTASRTSWRSGSPSRSHDDRPSFPEASVNLSGKATARTLFSGLLERFFAPYPGRRGYAICACFLQPSMFELHGT